MSVVDQLKELLGFGVRLPGSLAVERVFVRVVNSGQGSVLSSDFCERGSIPKVEYFQGIVHYSPNIVRIISPILSLAALPPSAASRGGDTILLP